MTLQILVIGKFFKDSIGFVMVVVTGGRHAPVGGLLDKSIVSEVVLV